MELIIVAIVVASAALVIARRAVRTWRRASAPRPAGSRSCGGGGCDGCGPPEPPSARLVQLGRRRPPGDGK